MDKPVVLKPWELVEASCDKVYHLRDILVRAHSAWPNAIPEEENWYLSVCGLKLVRRQKDYLYPACPDCQVLDV